MCERKQSKPPLQPFPLFPGWGLLIPKALLSTGAVMGWEQHHGDTQGCVFEGKGSDLQDRCLCGQRLFSLLWEVDEQSTCPAFPFIPPSYSPVHNTVQLSPSPHHPISLSCFPLHPTILFPAPVAVPSSPLC